METAGNLLLAELFGTEDSCICRLILNKQENSKNCTNTVHLKCYYDDKMLACTKVNITKSSHKIKRSGSACFFTIVHIEKLGQKYEAL